VSPGRKRIVFLCLTLLIGGGWISMAARSQDQKAQPVTDRGRSFLADPNFAGSQDISLSNKGLFGRMMFCIVLVAALGYGVMYVSKRVLPKVVNSPGKEIRIRETAYLGPRKALHLVEIGSHRLLVGSTNDSITTLADVTDTWLEVSKQETDEAVKL
jgi:flagellar biogenesis protein FliO